MLNERHLTKEEVFDACEHLWANNEPVTHRNVRDITKKGSFNTVKKFIDQWKKDNSDRQIIRSDYRISKELQDILDTANQRVVNQIAATIEIDTNNEAIKLLEDDNELLRNKLESAEFEIIRLKATLEERGGQRDDYFKQIIDLNQQLKELKSVLDENNSSFSKAYEMVQKVGINNLDLFIKIIGNPRVYELVMRIAANPEKYKKFAEEEKET